MKIEETVLVTYVKLPKLTWTMEEGFIGKWLKKQGEPVEKREAICEIETEKTVDEIEAPESGIIRKIIIPAGFTVPVNQTIAIIAYPYEEIQDLERIIEDAKKVMTRGTKPEAVTTKVEKPAPRVMDAERVKISPLARRLAEEQRINIMKIVGTGPGGRIVKEDVQRVIEAAKLTPASIPPTFERGKVLPLAGMRKVTAERLSLSARTAVHVPITMEVDMSEAVKLHERFRLEYEEIAKVPLSYTHVLIKAVAKALEDHPFVNSILENGQIRILEDINIGVAVASDDGLIVPVISNANKKSIREIAVTMQELVEKATQGKLLTREVSGGTFTITNLGMFGVDLFAPTINPPESAILGVGRIVRKPVAIDDEMVVKPMMTLTLVFDHRVMDGVQAARFLQSIKQILENPRTPLSLSE